MQLHLLSLVLLQPERSWTMQELHDLLTAPRSSIHRELERAEAAGIIHRDATARPHRFSAATEDPLYEPLTALLRLSVGIETQLRDALDRPDVQAAVIHGSWASGTRSPSSDIDLLVVGDVDLRAMRRLVRPIGKTAGRAIDLTVVTPDELRELVADRSSFARRLLEGPTVPLAGDLASIVQP